MSFARPEPLKHVPMPLRKVPDIARVKIIGLRSAVRTDHRRANPAFDDEGPLRGDRMPVQSTDATGIQRIDTPANPLETGNSLTVACLAQPPWVTCPLFCSMANRKVGNSSGLSLRPAYSARFPRPHPRPLPCRPRPRPGWPSPGILCVTAPTSKSPSC